MESRQCATFHLQVAGSTLGVTDNNNVDLLDSCIVDLLMSKGLTWKAYNEDYPGNCYMGNSKNNYVRKHNPLISFNSAPDDGGRCENIVNSSQFDQDLSKTTVTTPA